MSHLGRGLSRGAKFRCPNCGEGKLFRAYLKVAPACSACAHDLSRYRADDGPAYATVLLVGHLVIAPMLLFSFVWTMPAWAVLAITLPALLVVTLGALPVVKGAWVGMLWAHAQNGDPEYDPEVDPTGA